MNLNKILKFLFLSNVLSFLIIACGEEGFNPVKISAVTESGESSQDSDSRPKPPVTPTSPSPKPPKEYPNPSCAADITTELYDSKTWGHFLFTTNGNKVKAVYTYKKGVFIGQYNNKTCKLTGQWCEIEGKKQWQGDAEFILKNAKNGKILVYTGKWNEIDNKKWRHDWDLKHMDKSKTPSNLKRAYSWGCKIPPKN